MTALSGTDQTNLIGGTDICIPHLSVYTPQVIATALLNYPGGIIYTQIPDMPVDTTSAGWTTVVKPGMVAKIVSGSETRWLRVRKSPSSTSVLHLMETSTMETGLFAQEIFPVPLAEIDDNSPITIYDQYVLWTALPRISGGVIYEDYDIVSASTTYNRVAPPIVNLGKHRSQFCDAGTAYATMTFTCTATAWVGKTISTYAWTIPGSWTVTSGSSSTASFTAQVPAGQHLLRCTVTDSGGVSNDALRFVWAHDTGSNAPLAMSNVSMDSRDRTGRKQRVSLPDNILASIPDGAFVNYWEEASWNGATVSTATTNFSGWMSNPNYDMQPAIRRADIDIDGPAEVLRQLSAYSQYLERVTGTPASLQELKPELCTVDYVLYYTMLIRCPNLVRLFDHNPYSTAYTVATNAYLFPYYGLKSGTLLQQLQGLAGAIACNFGFDSTGACWVRRHPSYTQEYLTRSQTRRDTLTRARYRSIKAQRRIRPAARKGRVEAFATTTGADISTYICESPWPAPGQGTAEPKLEGIILKSDALAAASTVEAAYMTGGVYAMACNPYPQIEIDIPYNRDVYEPATMEPVDITANAGDSPDGVAWDRSIIPERVNKKVANNSRAAITLTAEAEVLGAPGTVGLLP